MNNRVYLISPDDVKAISNINYNVDDIDVSSAIRTAQNIYLRDIIGDKLLESLQEMVSANTIDNVENAAYKELLDVYVSDYLAYEAMVQALIPISFKIRNIGISQDYDSNIVASQMQTILDVEDWYRTQSIDKCSRMIKFIRSNRAAFPELEIRCICGDGEPHLKLRANTQLYLG